VLPLPVLKEAPVAPSVDPVSSGTSAPAAPAVVTPDVPTLDPSTSAEEKVAVENQIDNFANNISTDQIAQEFDGSASKSAETVVKDDSVLSQAVDDLSTNTPPNDTSSSIDEATKSSDQNSDDNPTIITPTQSKEEPQDDNNFAGGSSVTIANKKIIQPIKSEPKPRLDELLAAEEAKSNPAPSAISSDEVDREDLPSESSPQPGSTFGPSPTANSVKAPGQDNPAFDPNDIAL
jgi:hypothetical protein